MSIEELKQTLRTRAANEGIDLANAANRYTLWAENGGQGYLCWGRAPYPYEVYRLMGHYMFSSAAILEVGESRDRVTVFSSQSA